MTKKDWHEAKFDCLDQNKKRAILKRLWELENKIENTYLYLASRGYGKTQKRIAERVICIKCGRADKTLLKCENGKICIDCLKELRGKYEYKSKM